MNQPQYLPHKVTRAESADGVIVLRSAYPLGPMVEKTSDWLHSWSQKTPGNVFLAERSGSGWREITYGNTLERVRAIAASLLDRGLDETTPILIISGNSVDHGLLTLAAQYVGVPTVPVAEQYGLISAARKQLEHVAILTRPAMVFADDAERFAAALELPVFDRAEKLVSRGANGGQTRFDDLLVGRATQDTDAANNRVHADTVAKILMTSGSTSQPKGVMTTHRMMCTNQAQIAQALPFLSHAPPRIVDWLPWNHVFGGSHNFNMMLANGGSLYIDGGKPVPGLIEESIENLRLKTGTIAFNVPIGFARLRDVMRDDKAFRQSYFEELDMLFYAGASLPQDVWADLEKMAREVRGDMPLFTSSWGLTETSPASLLQHEPTHLSGIVGVPLAGLSVKLIPDNDSRYEVRVKGPTVFKGYYLDPEKTAAAFDEQGYFCTGDAMRFVDPDDMNLGLKFDGRISEDFKLLTGTWVQAASLRLSALAALGPLVADVIITGADRDQVGILLVPSTTLRERADVVEQQGAIVSKSAAEDIETAIAKMAPEGSSGHIRRALILAKPPALADGEITAKGNLNFNRILTLRADLLNRLYRDDDPATILM